MVLQGEIYCHVKTTFILIEHVNVRELNWLNEYKQMFIGPVYCIFKTQPFMSSPKNLY